MSMINLRGSDEVGHVYTIKHIHPLPRDSRSCQVRDLRIWTNLCVLDRLCDRHRLIVLDDHNLPLRIHRC